MKHDSNILKRIKNYFMRRKSSKEAYTFEREMEGDAFLYKAVEGFEDMLTSDIQQAMDELDDRLDERSRKGGFIITWRAAAIVAVIVAGTAVFAILGGQREEMDSAATEENRYSPRTDEPSYSAIDSEPTVKLDSTEVATSEEIESEVFSEPAVAVLEPELKNELNANFTAPAEEKRMFESERVESTSLSAGMATLDMADSVVAETLDDEVAFVQEEAEMVFETDELSREAAAPARRAKMMRQTMDEDVNSPEGGMTAYRNYLKNNLQRSAGMPNGEVVLRFTFDRSGGPKDIQVITSLCTACDAEAKRLIENGPKWNVSDRKQPVTITIDF